MTRKERKSTSEGFKSVRERKFRTQVPPEGVRKFRTRQYGKVPASVARDKSLSPAARLVYVELVQWQFGKSNQVQRGIRAIAEALGLSVETVQSGLKDLAKADHIKAISKGHQRGKYILLSPVFGTATDLEHPEVRNVALQDGHLYRDLMTKAPVSAPRSSRRTA